jgi:DNA polymerase III subunit epsilon
MRQVVLDTETTGLEASLGHRIIEIGCVELVNRRLTGNHFHQYINPQRDIDQGALQVHGITTEFLQDKPTFDRIAESFLNFIGDAELIIHNAPFDVEFLNAELRALEGGQKSMQDRCSILDTLVMARQKHPGQRNSLDALCRRYEVDNSRRELHGALLDAEILADVYLAMTGGQVGLQLSGQDGSGTDSAQGEEKIRRLPTNRQLGKVIRASDVEIQAHLKRLAEIDRVSPGAVWLRNGD